MICVRRKTLKLTMLGPEMTRADTLDHLNVPAPDAEEGR